MRTFSNFNTTARLIDNKAAEMIATSLDCMKKKMVRHIHIHAVAMVVFFLKKILAMV